MGHYIIWKADTLMIQLGMVNTLSLDATLIIAYYYKGMINIIMYGDGCIFNIDKIFTIIKTVEYSKNTPYYLSYGLNCERNEIYRTNKITKIVDKQYRYNSSTPPDLITNIIDCEKPYVSKYIFDDDRDRTILICSDGISTFFNKKQQEFLPVKDLIQDFSSFKTLKGEFLQRRLLSKKGAITKLEHQGYDHFDDLSVGAFVIKGE